MKFRFNFVSKDADGMGFAYALSQNGEDVRLFIDEADASAVGDGLVPKVGSIHDLLQDAKRDSDIFIFDTSGDGLLADYLRSIGHYVLGASGLADRLERDRTYGLEVMEENGIETPDSLDFRSFDDAIEYVSEADERLVYKPSNLLGDKSPSHVSYNQEDMVKFLENIRDEVSIENPEIVLQEFKEGLCISTEMWFDGSRARLMNHTFERKELMDGNVGPSGGCTGNIVWSCGECPLCEQFRGMIPWLEHNGYHGMLDLNAILTEDGVLGLEWTPRFGYDATPTLLMGLLDGDLGHFFSDMATRKYGEDSPKLCDGVAGGLRLSVPPWPTEKYLASAGAPIFGLPEDAYLYNVKRGDVTKVETAGAWGILACLVKYGDSIKKAVPSPEGIHVANLQYRTDLVGQFEEDLEKLEALLENAKTPS